MDLIYLDYNCFQRGFDDIRQLRIHMEALACQEIFLRAEYNKIKLVWSFMHEDETLLCPFPERKFEALRLAQLCKNRMGPVDGIYKQAKLFETKGRLSAKDAVHLACATYIKADFFFTCDDILIKKGKKLKIPELIIENPIDYIMLR